MAPAWYLYRCVTLRQELGFLRVHPGEAFLLPAGLRMSVSFLPSQNERGETSIQGRGWACEVFSGHFRLPDLGPLGSNAMADTRHFKVPVAAYEDKKVDHETICKYGGSLHSARQEYSPFDVVGWCGNYLPCKYDMSLFLAVGSTTWDHIDPSSHCVLTVPMDTRGAVCDFVVFKGRWDASEDTFRPPYYHRNAASEFNAVVKIDEPYVGLDQGVSFYTPLLSAHGISAQSCNNFLKVPEEKLNTPMRLSDDSLWIMFESALPLCVTPWAMHAAETDDNYRAYSKPLQRLFTPGRA